MCVVARAQQAACDLLQHIGMLLLFHEKIFYKLLQNNIFSLNSGAHPATPAHTPNTSTLNRSSGGLSTTSRYYYFYEKKITLKIIIIIYFLYFLQLFSFAFHNVSPDQLFAGLSRIQVQQGGSIGKIHFRFDRNSADALKK